VQDIQDYANLIFGIIVA